jgi:propanediol dehydratase small subunit
MRLSLQRLRLQHEIKRDNYRAIVELRRQNLFRIAKTLDLAPDHRIAQTVYEAITRKVERLKTKDPLLLSYATKIESAFAIKVLAI